MVTPICIFLMICVRFNQFTEGEGFLGGFFKWQRVSWVNKVSMFVEGGVYKEEVIRKKGEA